MSSTVSQTDNFLKAIEKYAEEQRRRIRTEVEDLREKELARAEEEALREAYELLRRQMADAQTELASRVSCEENEGRKKVFQRRKEIEERVFADVRKKLSDYTRTPAYEKLLQESVLRIRECLQADDLVIFCRQEDKALLDRLCALQAIPCRAEVSEEITLGGLIGRSASLGLLSDDTLDTRLQMQYEWFYEHAGLSVTE